MNKKILNRIESLDFEGFKKLALDDELTKHEKIGFLNSDREGKEGDIISDIVSKAPKLSTDQAQILDIGSGCGVLTEKLVQHCAKYRQDLTLIDSKEMLSQLESDYERLNLEAGYFPNEFSGFLEHKKESFDVIIVYSVLHYVLQSGDLFLFIDSCVTLLKDGGTLILGDLPNLSKRNRFFTTEKGVQFHRNYTGDNSFPEMKGISLSDVRFDDGIILGILSRYRNLGYETYLLPQPFQFSMANRREDIVIQKI